jgi:hypothetical protein
MLLCLGFGGCTTTDMKVPDVTQLKEESAKHQIKTAAAGTNTYVTMQNADRAAPTLYSPE